jgi:hypothetical protein
MIEREINESIINDFPIILSEDERAKLIKEWQSRFSNVNFERQVCASCSLFEFAFKDHFEWIPYVDLDLSLLTNPGLPDILLPISYSISIYKKAILNPKGLCSLNEPGPLLLCPACKNDLLVRHRIPEFALANWLYYAQDRLPQEVCEAFETASPFELQLVMRATGTRIIHRYSDKDPSLGTQKYNKGSLLVLPQDSLSVRKFLPPSTDSVCDTMCALFIGNELPTRENISKLGPVLVRKSKIKIIIEFLVGNNRFYAPDDDFQGFSLDSFNNYEELDPASEGPSSLPAQLTIHHLQPSDALESLESDYTLRNETGDSTNDDLLMENVGYTDGNNSKGNYSQMKIQAVQHCLQGNFFIKSVRGSGPLGDFHSEEIMSWNFPHLDPWGIGGFYEPRRIRDIDMKRQLTHALKIDDSPFERDPVFAFLFFNVLQKRANVEAAHFRVKGKHQQWIVGALRDISAHPEELSQLSKRFSENPKYNPTSTEEKRLMQVLNNIRMIPQDVPGSGGYKQCCRNEIHALVNRYGAPALFITINPADIHNPLVRLLAGEEIDLEELEKNVPMSRADQRILVGERPGAASRFFNLVMRSFVDILLYNRSTDGSGVGIFGKCKAHYGMVEAQGRGTLHCHLLIWLCCLTEPPLQVVRSARAGPYICKTQQSKRILISVYMTLIHLLPFKQLSMDNRKRGGVKTYCRSF